MAFDREEFYREVGLRIHIARKRNQLTQQELADALAIPRATYANVESGRQRIVLDLAWKIAAVLRMSLDTLVPEPVEAPRPETVQQMPTSGTAWITVKSPVKTA